MSPHRKIPGINLCLAFEIGDAVLRKMDAPSSIEKKEGMTVAVCVASPTVDAE